MVRPLRSLFSYVVLLSLTDTEVSYKCKMKTTLLNLFIKYQKLIQYFFIGISAAVIDVVVFWFLFNWFDYSATASTAVSIALATIWGFTFNAFFNFKVSDRLFRRLFSYSFVSFVGLVLSTVVLYFSVDKWGFDGNAIKILTLPLVFLVQYTLNKTFTFNMKESQAPIDDQIEVSTKVCTKSKNVAVIGGGFTGLVAAYDLAKLGHSVTIYEMNDHVGGLAASFEIAGYPIERAYHFLYQSDSDILTLASELGIGDKFHFHPSGIRYFHEGIDYPFNTPIDLLQFKPLSFFNRIRLGVLTLYLKQVKNWRPLSTITAWDWLNKWMGKQVTVEVWEPLLVGKFNRYYDKITMSWLWGRFNIRAQSQNKDFSGEKLGYPDGSFSIIVDALLAELSAKGAIIKTSTGIKSITKYDDSTILETMSGDTISYDSVVSTIPSPVFAKLIANNNVEKAYLDKLQSIDYLDAVVMVFCTSQRLTDTFWYNIKDPRVPFLTLLSTSALAGTDRYDGNEMYFVGAYVPREHEYMNDDADIKSEWINGLRVMFPDFDESQIKELKISKFNDAQHIVDLGYEENKLVPFETPVEGVFLANFSQIYPDDRGTNFAVRDGRRVAELVQNYFNSKYGK